MQGTRNLTEGPVMRQLFRLSMPIMATSFIQMAYTLTDMAWVGRIGSEALAAIGAVGILTWMSASFSLLSKVGSEVSVGQSIGARNETDAKRFASHNITLALILSLVWGGLLFICARQILNLFGLETHLTPPAVSYLRTIIIAFPFYFLSAAFTGIYNASGRSNIPFYVNATGLILNVVLDPLFIFGFNLGTQGAAYATCIAQVVVCLLFVRQLRFRDKLLGGFPFLTHLQKKYALRIFKLGAPVAVFNSLFAIINMAVCRLAAQYGGHIGLMTFTTGGQIEAITWNTAQGFATALSAFVAQNFAAGRHDRVLHAWRKTLWMTSIFGLCCSLLFIFFGNEVFSIFTPETEAYLSGGVFLKIDGYSQIFMMMEITTQGMFYGVGRTLPPAFTSIALNSMRIPIAILLVGLGLGVEGIWWAVCITTTAKGLVLTIWFAIARKKIFQSGLSTVGSVQKN